jgi:arylsulfatase A-like enzyme
MVLSRRAFVSGCAAPAFLKAAERPNILWIFGDDLGVELGCYGHKLVRTPNIDRIANEGVRFERCYTTAPVCSASRSAFNVGLYQTTTGTHHHRSHRQDGYRLPGGAKLLSHRLRDAGYFTANVLDIAPGVRGSGKTDFNFKTDSKPFQGTHWNQRADGQPFYAQINFTAPHKGPSFVEARTQKSLIDPAKVELPPYYPDHPVVRDEVANYLDAVQLLDSKVGVVLDRLEKEKLLDTTVIFLIGDNGRSLLRGKQWLYDAGTHVPLIVRWPGVAARGSVNRDLVSALDWTASTLDIAWIPRPEPFHGQALFGSSYKPRPHVVTCRDRCDMTLDRIRALRDGRYKLIRNLMPERPYTQYNQYIETSYPTLGVMKELHAKGKLDSVQEQFMAPRKPELEFYDTAEDPHEVRNLAGEARHKARIASMSARLDAWFKAAGDTGAVPEDPKAAAGK